MQTYTISGADAGLSNGNFTLAITILIASLLIVAGIAVWGVWINKKSSRKTTVITISDEDEIEPNTINTVEDMTDDDKDDKKIDPHL